jgi:uncharacterized membrane protein YqjE
MDQEGLPKGGLVASVRRLIDTVLALFQTRFELFTLELQEEKQRFIGIMIWACLGVAFAWMAMTFITLTIVYLFWENARLIVLALFALLYLSLTLVAVRALWVRLKKGKPFAATLEELKKDRACLNPKN